MIIDMGADAGFVAVPDDCCIKSLLAELISGMLMPCMPSA